MGQSNTTSSPIREQNEQMYNHFKMLWETYVNHNNLDVVVKCDVSITLPTHNKPFRILFPKVFIEDFAKTELTFGKYKGKRFEEVYVNDRKYSLYILKQTKLEKSYLTGSKYDFVKYINLRQQISPEAFIKTRNTECYICYGEKTFLAELCGECENFVCENCVLELVKARFGEDIKCGMCREVLATFHCDCEDCEDCD